MSDYVAGLTLSPDLAEAASRLVGRQWLLSSVEKWFSGSGSRVFVIVGPPGSGKTTFAAWLTSSNTFAEVLVARFCSLRDPSSGDALTFIESLARALSASYPGFAEALSSVTEIRIETSVAAQNVSPGGTVTGVYIENQQLNAMSARRAFDRFIRTPLKLVPPPTTPFLIIVDALDEALIDASDNSLLDVLVTGWVSDKALSSQIRLLVTTRASPATSEFISNALVTNMDESSPENMADLYAFIRQRLNSMPEADSLANRVASASNGSFLYARYVVDDLLAHPDRGRDTDMLPLSIEEFYRQNFKNAFLERGLWEQR